MSDVPGYLLGVGDALRIPLPDKSVDLIIGSPPSFNGSEMTRSMIQRSARDPQFVHILDLLPVPMASIQIRLWENVPLALSGALKTLEVMNETFGNPLHCDVPGPSGMDRNEQAICDGLRDQLGRPVPQYQGHFLRCQHDPVSPIRILFEPPIGGASNLEVGAPGIQFQQDLSPLALDPEIRQDSFADANGHTVGREVFELRLAIHRTRFRQVDDTAEMLLEQPGDNLLDLPEAHAGAVDRRLAIALVPLPLRGTMDCEPSIGIQRTGEVSD
jgi:hypothetical protein